MNNFIDILLYEKKMEKQISRKCIKDDAAMIMCY